MFGMPGDVNGTAFEDPGTPSFRALFAYFVRRRDSGAFLYPERQAEQQQRGDWQVNLSYLLGLDWQIPFEFQKVRGRERTLEELKKAAGRGAWPSHRHGRRITSTGDDCRDQGSEIARTTGK